MRKKNLNREIPRVVLKDHPADPSWARASVRKKIVSLVLKPAVDQRFDGMSKEAVEKDQDRQAFSSIQVNRVMGSSRKKELLEEFFPNKGEKFPRISDRSKRS